MNKKTKNMLIIISVVMILVAVIIIISKLISPTTSTNNTNTNIKDTTIDGLRISNVNLVGNHLTAYVQNTTSNSISIKTITVKFIDKDNNEIDSVNAYFGGVFASNEIRNLDVKTDADLSNFGDISYKINYSSCIVTRSQYKYSAGAMDGTWIASYQCNGLTGTIVQCAYTGRYANYRGTWVGRYENLVCDGGSLKVSKTYACTSNYDNSSFQRYCSTKASYQGYSKGGTLPKKIDCTCD